MGNQFFKGASDGFLEHLGDFPADGGSAAVADNFGHLFQQFDQPEGRLIEDHGARFFLQGGQPLHSPLFLGQESLEDKPVGRESGVNQCGHESGRPGEALHFDAVFEAGAYQQESRIRDPRGSRIGNQRHRNAGFDFGGNGPDHRMFVEFVVGGEFVDDSVMVEEPC